MRFMLLYFVIGLALAQPAQAQHEFDTTGSGSPKHIRYGEKRGERVAVYTARGVGSAPVVLFFSGYDWRSPPHPERLDKLHSLLRDQGFAIVFLSYPSKIDQEFERKVAAQITALRAARHLKLDFGRVALWGQGTGGLYAGLIATDTNWARRVGLDPDALKCVVTTNGEGFDIARSIAASSPQRASALRTLFPDKAAIEYSPMTHIAAPNVPAFLLMSDPVHAWSRRDGADFGDALRRHGVLVEVEQMPAHDNSTPDLYLGTPQNRAGQRMVRFLSKHLEAR